MKVTLESLPETLDELALTLPLDAPENTAALLIAALFQYEEDRLLGIEMINHLKGPLMLNSEEIELLRELLRGSGILPLSYFEGATPQNGYAPDKPYTVTVTETVFDCPEPGYARVLLATSGNPHPRAVVLRKKDADWFLWDHSDILCDIEKPVAEDPFFDSPPLC